MISGRMSILSDAEDGATSTGKEVVHVVLRSTLL
jgi:hypothetical protein